MVSIATRVWEKRSQFFPFNAERQAREALVPFFTSVVWRGQDLEAAPTTLEAGALPLVYRGSQTSIHYFFTVYYQD